MGLDFGDRKAPDDPSPNAPDGNTSAVEEWPEGLPIVLDAVIKGTSVDTVKTGIGVRNDHCFF